jgi:hypothetical protein
LVGRAGAAADAREVACTCALAQGGYRGVGASPRYRSAGGTHRVLGGAAHGGGLDLDGQRIERRDRVAVDAGEANRRREARRLLEVLRAVRAAVGGDSRDEAAAVAVGAAQREEGHDDLPDDLLGVEVVLHAGRADGGSRALIKRPNRQLAVPSPGGMRHHGGGKSDDRR